MKVRVRQGFSIRVGKDVVIGPAEIDVDPKQVRKNMHKLELMEELPDMTQDKSQREVPEPQPLEATQANPNDEVKPVPEPEPKETSFATPLDPNVTPEPQPLEASETASEEALPARDEHPANLVADQDSPSSPTKDPVHATPATEETKTEEVSEETKTAESTEEAPAAEAPKKTVRKKKRTSK